MTLWCHSESGRTFEAFFTLPKRAARTTPSKDDERLSKVGFGWILSFAEAQQNIPDVCWRANERTSPFVEEKEQNFSFLLLQIKTFCK